MASLPLVVKILIGTALIANFIIITQWERLPFAKRLMAASPPPAALAPARPTHPDIDRTKPTAASEPDSEAARQSLVRRMAPITIEDPKIQSDGSIENGDSRLVLYGIKPFNSKSVCTRASGERWACGLHAYATLRNELARKTIVCQPKKILDQALTATCRTGGIDVALILVRNGLVEVTSDAPTELLQAQATARNSKTGIWDR